MIVNNSLASNKVQFGASTKQPSFLDRSRQLQTGGLLAQKTDDGGLFLVERLEDDVFQLGKYNLEQSKDFKLVGDQFKLLGDSGKILNPQTAPGSASNSVAGTIKNGQQFIGEFETAFAINA